MFFWCFLQAEMVLLKVFVVFFSYFGPYNTGLLVNLFFLGVCLQLLDWYVFVKKTCMKTS